MVAVRAVCPNKEAKLGEKIRQLTASLQTEKMKNKELQNITVPSIIK
jgi:hypothetical protein